MNRTDLQPKQANITIQAAPVNRLVCDLDTHLRKSFAGVFAILVEPALSFLLPALMVRPLALAYAIALLGLIVGHSFIGDKAP